MGNTHSSTTRRQTAPRKVKTRKSPARFSPPSQRRANAAPVVQPSRKFGFGSSRKHRQTAAPVAKSTIPSNSMSLRNLKAKISPGPKIATTNKKSRKHTKKDPVNGFVNKFAPAAATAGVSAAPKRQSHGMGFGSRKQDKLPLTSKRRMFSMFKKARKH